MSIKNDKYYVGVPELQRRVDTTRALEMERSSLERRVSTYNAGHRHGDSYESLTRAVSDHNAKITAFNDSVRDFKPGRSDGMDWYRTPGAWRR